MLDGIPIACRRHGESVPQWSARSSCRPDDAEVSFVAAVPDVAAEMVVPIKVGRRTVGVLNVESDPPIADADVEEIQLVAIAMEERMEEVGADLPDSALHRLARSNTELALLAQINLIEMASTPYGVRDLRAVVGNARHARRSSRCSRSRPCRGRSVPSCARSPGRCSPS